LFEQKGDYIAKKAKIRKNSTLKCEKMGFNLFYCEKQKLLRGIIDKVSLQKLGGHKQGKV